MQRAPAFVVRGVVAGEQLGSGAVPVDRAVLSLEITQCMGQIEVIDRVGRIQLHGALEVG